MTKDHYPKQTQPNKSHSIHYSKDLEGMLLEVYDIEGMFPLFIKVPSVEIRKVSLVNKKDRSRGLQMT